MRPHQTNPYKEHHHARITYKKMVETLQARNKEKFAQFSTVSRLRPRFFTFSQVCISDCVPLNVEVAQLNSALVLTNWPFIQRFELLSDVDIWIGLI